jgi:hypothetical protein
MNTDVQEILQRMVSFQGGPEDECSSRIRNISLDFIDRYCYWTVNLENEPGK